MSATDLRALALRDVHHAAGARFAPFAGWEMPLQYEGIVAEHLAVRGRAGVFDVSHMGRVWVEGREATARLRSALTYDIRPLAPGEAHYALYCTDEGGIADDVFAFRLAEERWLVVHNAANAASGRQRLLELGAPAREVTAETVMLAVQGPEARAAVASIVGDAVLGIELRHCVEVERGGEALVVSRTGYTGEDGFEVTASPTAGRQLWNQLVAAGVQPAGLGARDTLRLEAALPLHGEDIDASTTPYEAGLGWTVTLDDGADFVGRERLAKLSERPRERRLAHLRLAERGVPRPGFAVIDPGSGEQAGALTSGSHSPTLGAGIGMAYLPADLSRRGTRLSVRVRDRDIAAEVVRRPFYQRQPAAEAAEV